MSRLAASTRLYCYYQVPWPNLQRDSSSSSIQCSQAPLCLLIDDSKENMLCQTGNVDPIEAKDDDGCQVEGKDSNLTNQRRLLPLSLVVCLSIPPSTYLSTIIAQMLRRIVAPCYRLRQSPLHRTYASVPDLQHYLRPGDSLHGFTLLRKENVPELELSALQFTHDKTGAEYLHIARDDTNNVFSIGFKTNPPDATGVPHILEHVTLCGSEKCVVHHNRRRVKM